MHPVSASRIVANADIKIHAANLLEKVVSNKAKSELAHRLSIKLASDPAAKAAFIVPSYLSKAIKYVVKGEIA